MLSAPRRSCPIGSSWHFSSVFSLPNRRLKLAGGDRFRGNGVLCPWPGADCRPLLLRRLASRPQLKHDPLGSHVNHVTFGAAIVHRLPIRAFWIAACLLSACHTASHVSSASPAASPSSSITPVPWCVVPGTKVDSAFAVAQARRILESPDLPLTPQAVDTVAAVAKDSSFHLRFEEGFLVRLIPVAKNTLGGGGLAFVNSGTGCPILLIHYE